MKNMSLLIGLVLAFSSAWGVRGEGSSSCQYKAEKTIKVAVGPWKPWTIVDNTTGEMSGWDIDYLREVFSVMGVTNYKLVQTSWGSGCCETKEVGGETMSVYPGGSDYFMSVFNGHVDMGMSVTSNSDRRIYDKISTPTGPMEGFKNNVSNRYGFGPAFVTFSYFESDAAKFDLKTKGIEMLEGQKVGIAKKGTNQDFYLKLLKKETSINFDVVYAEDVKKEMGVAASEDDGEALLAAMDQGKVNILFASSGSKSYSGKNIVSKGSIRDHDTDRFDRAWGRGAVIYFYPRGDKKLVEKVNCAIAKIASEKKAKPGQPGQSDLYDVLKKRYKDDYGRFLCNPELSYDECVTWQEQ